MLTALGSNYTDENKKTRLDLPRLFICVYLYENSILNTVVFFFCVFFAIGGVFFRYLLQSLFALLNCTYNDSADRAGNSQKNNNADKVI